MNIEKLVKHLEVGQTIILKLRDEIVIGELSIKSLPSHLRLKNCRDYQNNEDLGVQNIYYINEIQDIRVPHENTENKETFDAIPPAPEDKEEVKETQKTMSIRLRDDKLRNIQEILNKRVYINRCDAKYFNACKDLLSQRQIGVCFEDVRYGRRSKASVLAVSTDKTIYIFDLLLLDGIKQELAAVFQSKSVCKIVHYSKMTYDYLRHACKIKANFLFDTMMAYFYVSGTREVLTITELISILFNLPQMEPSTNVIWDSRPISEETISQAGFSVAFLIEIQQYLMHRHLLRSFYRASAAAMSQLSDTDEYPYTIKPVHGREVLNDIVLENDDDEFVDLREKCVPIVKENDDKTSESTKTDTD